MSCITLSNSCEPSAIRCIICSGECETLGRVASFVAGYPPLDFARCRDCQTLTFADSSEMIGYNSNDFAPEEYYRHYIHVGAGITGMLEPLMALPNSGSLLDVGCGFGYIVDYWLKIKNEQAFGLEIAAYGRMGRKLLNAPIFHNYLGECPSVDERSFDIVYSCEVIEHTSNPLDFCKKLKARCTPGGLVVLTAPSARIVWEDNRESDKLAALSPYFHLFLPSKKGMAKLLKDAGFAYYHIHDSGMRLYVWASMEPLPEIAEPRLAINWQDYFRYLRLLAQNDDADVSSGALYRLCKDQWFAGSREEGYRSFLEFEKHIARHFGIHLRTIRFADIEPHIRVNDLRRAPAWLAVSLHIGSIMVKRFERKRVVARNMALTAEQTIRLLLSEVKFKQFSQEAEHFLPKVIKNRRKLNRFARFWQIMERISP